MPDLLDLSYLHEISGGDKEFIREMLELYLNHTAPEASRFPELLANSDYQGIGHLAHKIKAPVQMLGAKKLQKTLQTLEQYGKDKSHLGEIADLILRIQQMIEDTERSARDHLKQLDAS